VTPIEVKIALIKHRDKIHRRLATQSQYTYTMTTLGDHLNYCKHLIGCSDFDWNKYVVSRLTETRQVVPG